MTRVVTKSSHGFRLPYRVVDANGEAIGDATSVDLVAEKPSGATITKTMVQTNPPGTDGRWHYVIASGDLDEPGTWKAELDVTSPGFTGRLKTLGLLVRDTL